MQNINGKNINDIEVESTDGLWNADRVCQYFDDPGELLQDPTIQRWIADHGGIDEIDEFLRQQRLSKTDEKLLHLLLDNPMQSADFYFSALNIVSSSFYRRRKNLARKLAAYLNLWEATESSNNHSFANSQLEQSSDKSPLSQIQVNGSSNIYPTNIPTPLSTFFGREHEISTALLLFQNESIRFVTLTGLGGIGKTRLALQIGLMVQEYFVDGVFFASLANVTDVEDIPHIIAQSLNIKNLGVSVIHHLKNYLRGRSMLLILDNLEQILESVDFINDLLESTGYIKILATSRIPLHSDKEQEISLSPFQLPNPHRLPSLAVLACSPIIQIFVERAQSVRYGFQLTPDNALAIVTLCHRLEGIPLALELAAARLKFLSLTDILSRLDKRLVLLKGEINHLPHRQRTMYSTVAWSYELLSPYDKGLFVCLSIFAGGWMTASAEVVFQEVSRNYDILSGLESLLESNLIYYQDYEGADTTPRFNMLEIIREFAHEQLSKKEKEQYRQKHLEYFYAFTQIAEPKLTSDDQIEWLIRVEQDIINIRAALTYALDTSQTRYALQMTASLWHFWLIGGYLIEGIRWLERSVSCDTHIFIEDQAKALFVLGNLVLNNGDFDRGIGYIQQSIDFCEQCGNIALAAKSLRNLGKAFMANNDYAKAKPLIEKSLKLFRSLSLEDVNWDIAWTLNTLGIIEAHIGDSQTSLSLYDEGLTIFRNLGDKHGTSWSLTSVADYYYNQGDYDRSELLYAECLQLRRVLGDKWGCAWALLALGKIAYQKGIYNQTHCLKESLLLYSELENINGIIICSIFLSMSMIRGGDLQQSSLIDGMIEQLVQDRQISLHYEEMSLYEEYKDMTKSVVYGSEHALSWANGKTMELDEYIKIMAQDKDLMQRLY